MKTRRDFIKISALGFGAVAAGGTAIQKMMAHGLADENPAITAARFPSYCEVCFWKCAKWAHVDDAGRVINLSGIDNDPHCNGRLCPRGNGGIGMLYDEDRLTTPLIRVEENGQQTFRQASWDEALQLIADKMQEMGDNYGPETMALFKHGSSGDHFGRLFKAYGSNNVAAPSYAQCRGPREAGFKLTFGATIGSPEPTDIRDTKCLVLIGSHIGENMHNGQVQEMSDAIDKGATIITVDPRYSVAASKSQYWLPIKPATDIALLLAWMNVIINEELYDKAYVEQNSIGFDRLKYHVRRMTPEWAYGITGLKPDLIRNTARAMAHAAPATIVHPGRHVTWYGDDTQRSRAIAILNALLGSWGRRGGFYFKEGVKVPDFPHPEYPKPRWDWQDTLNGKYPFAGLAVSNALIDASLPEADPERKIRGWFVTGTNLPLTMPENQKFDRAAQEAEFIVVCDTMPMEITGYADVVLPECTYLERYDELRTSGHRQPNVALRMPVTEPLGDSKPAWWMARELAHKMGLEDYFNYTNYEEVLDWQLKKIGSSLDEMKRVGVKYFPRKYDLYAKEGEPMYFYTESGKIEFYSKELEEMGFDPIPNYVKHPEPPKNYYRLNYGRAPMHTFSRTSNNPHLTDLMAENKLWVHPKVARIWGLKKDQEVWLKNQDGVVSSFPIKLRITERIRWDSVYMVHGFGHDQKELTRAYGKGINDTEMISKVQVDPLMGGTGMRGNFVTFLTEKPA